MSSRTRRIDLGRSTRPVDVERLDAHARRADSDEVAVEEPLEIRISGDTLAITMRTPGHDRELVLGFLFAEGVIRSRDDIVSIAHCGRTGDEARENTIDVTLAPGVERPEGGEPLGRRGTITTSACGVCGRRSIDDLIARCEPITPGAAVASDVISRAVRALGERQPIFGRTGGCHAASLHTFAGEHVATFEDVGRHNAVDKLVGSRVRAGTMPLDGHVLIVSGRSSFEIVQKALAARIPVVASVSAPSSLAVDLARRANLTLIGFARGESMTVYAGGTRVIGSA